MIAWFTATRLGRWIAGAAAAVVTLFGVYFAGRATGGAAAKDKMKRRDLERALETKEKVDAAIRDRDVSRPVDERLRERGRLRD